MSDGRKLVCAIRPHARAEAAAKIVEKILAGLEAIIHGAAALAGLLLSVYPRLPTAR
jgi:hypothetical protein